ncbi:unnamed protein product [Chironomus riparius]|uniref:Uncharacterized protein n=1 Tax=Chironomus riparius TaxID=315576 RepID=A0A9N9WP92_9DIPT|nr:unnamed protein product [Chironomus riparius]
MSQFQIVSRCDDCKKLCRSRPENITRTQSRCVLVQASEISREASTDEMDEKLNVWAALSPPIISSYEDFNSIDLIALEKATALRNGKIVLDKKLNVESFYEKMDEHETLSIDDDPINIQDVADDDDDDVSS